VSRSTELARLAIRRHEATGMALEDSVASAIRQALREQAQVDELACLPHAQAVAIDLLRQHGQLRPEIFRRFSGTSRKSASLLLRRMHHAGLVDRVRFGVYVLANQWRRQADLAAQRRREAKVAGGERVQAARRLRARPRTA
jgi:hypothetical protein